MRTTNSDRRDALDVVQARRLANLISSHVAHLESIASDESEERETILTITSAATQLAALLRPPSQVILEIATGFTLSAALRLVVEAHVPEIIRALSTATTTDRDDNGVPISDISVLYGVSAPKLERILRLLATHHIFAECPPSSHLSDVDASYDSDSNSFGRRPYTSPSPLSTSQTRPHLPTDDHSVLDQFEQSGVRRACFVGEGELCAGDVKGEEGRVGNANAIVGARARAKRGGGGGEGEARFAHTRLSEVLDSGVDLTLLDLDLDLDLAALPARLSSFLTVGKEEGKVTVEIEMDGLSGGGGSENKMKMEINGGNRGEDERRKKRWATKYGAEAPGAGLAALVGILTDESMFHATALTEVLLGSHRLPQSTSPTSSLVPPSSAAQNPDTSSSSLTSPGKEAHSLNTRSNAEKEEVSKDSDSTDSGLKSEDLEDSPLRTAFSLSRCLPRTTMFEWLSAGGNAHRLHRFGCAMRGMGSLTPESAILKGFDFASLPRGATIVDVGGGVGAASLPILRAYPHLSLVVQDTEGVVGVAPGFWEAQYPEAIREGRVRFQVQSFFDAQPSSFFEGNNKLNNGFDDGLVNGLRIVNEKGEGGGRAPDVFLLRMIMHNWPDAECLRILRRLREAAGERTRLVLVDSVLMAACRGRGSRGGLTEPEVDTDDDGKMRGGHLGAKVMKEAPEPLLANWGVANGLAYRLDLIMLANHNAGERTLPAFDALLTRSGWAIREVYAASESWMPQIVAIPVPDPISAPGCTSER